MENDLIKRHRGGFVQNELDVIGVSVTNETYGKTKALASATSRGPF